MKTIDNINFDRKRLEDAIAELRALERSIAKGEK